MMTTMLAEDRNSASPGQLVASAEVSLRGGRFREAVSTLLSARQLNAKGSPPDPEMDRRISRRVSATIKQMEETADSYREGEPQIFIDLGLAYLDIGSPYMAAEAIQRGLRKRPSSSRLHYYMGLAASHTGDVTSSIASFRSCLNLRGKLLPTERANALQFLGQQYLSLRLIEQAIEYLEEAANLEPNANLLTSLLEAYRLRGGSDWDENRVTAELFRGHPELFEVTSTNN